MGIEHVPLEELDPAHRPLDHLQWEPRRQSLWELEVGGMQADQLGETSQSYSIPQGRRALQTDVSGDMERACASLQQGIYENHDDDVSTYVRGRSRGHVIKSRVIKHTLVRGSQTYHKQCSPPSASGEPQRRPPPNAGLFTAPLVSDPTCVHSKRSYFFY